jgi:outer membrane receptor protein involved in Fe transport
MSKSLWLVSAGLFALATTPAHAQDQTSPTGETSPVQEAGEVAADTDVAPTDEVAEQAMGDTAEGGDIVITAQGRAQVLQDVPIAVSAVSAESLQTTGATDIRQLNQLAPSLLVSSTGSEANGSARIRGIGTVGDNPGLESSVAVFIDGVYRSRSGVGLNELGEIERVEVLRGPQGTLFGRNASAGLINIISKKPNMNEFEAFGELSYGNYDFIRAGGGATGPIGDTLGFRVDGVYSRRDGFYKVVAGGVENRVNDRDRIFLRGQLLFEPSDALELRLIADYSKRDEACCAAVYVDRATNPLIGNLNEPATPLLVGGVTNPNGNNIINVLLGLGQNQAAFSNPYSRNLYLSTGRSFAGETEDKGISLQADWDFGGASLTSITAYRDYDSNQGSDTDYSQVDILYRAPDGGSSRRFKTFSQELRLQGNAFGDKLDWLVGAYYADEDLAVTDNLRFGSQYGRFATCRIISGGGLSGLFSPGNPSCVLPGVGPATLAGATGASGPDIVAGFARLDSLNDRGSTLDRYNQNSRNYAFFTHNIFHITDTLALTIGLRYTNERKAFQATFGNDNTVCTALQASLLDDLTTTTAGTPTQIGTARALAGALIGLGCQGNSTAELNGVTIRDRRSEDEFTGTGVLSFKPSDDLLLYASYSRGYKAGGFNLDRSALKAPILPFALTPGGAQGLVGNLQFDPEINNALELGAKFSRGIVTANVALFRQDFRNFQLNTFNGTVFLVQNINACENDLAGGDRDLSATTGSCPADDVTFGVRSQGFEIETQFRPRRDLSFNVGFTYSDTKYRNNLVGNRNGVPLDPALRKLPGDNLSNAPTMVTTTSLAWTPKIGSSGMSALFYVDSRLTSDYNTGSDLFPQKEEDGYALFNARIGIRGRAERWSLELWGQNIFNQRYAQVAFNSPFQAGTTAAPFVDPQFPGGRQIFSAFLAEPRTYGVTGRFRF